MLRVNYSMPSVNYSMLSVIYVMLSVYYSMLSVSYIMLRVNHSILVIIDLGTQTLDTVVHANLKFDIVRSRSVSL